MVLAETEVVGVIGVETCANVKVESHLAAEVEVVDETYATGEVVITATLPAVTTVSCVIVGSVNPVVTYAGIKDTVVDTAGTIAAPPVGEVQHCVELSTELVALVLVISNVAVTELAIPAIATVAAKTLELSEVGTGTETDDG